MSLDIDEQQYYTILHKSGIKYSLSKNQLKHSKLLNVMSELNTDNNVLDVPDSYCNAKSFEYCMDYLIHHEK